MAGESADQTSGVIRSPGDRGVLPESHGFNFEVVDALIDGRSPTGANRTEFLAAFAADLKTLVHAAAVVIQSIENGQVRLLGLEAPPATVGEPGNWIPSAAEVEAVCTAGSVGRLDVIIGGRHHARIMVPVCSEGEAPVCLSAFLEAERAASVHGQAALLGLASLAVARRDALARLGEGEAAFRQATLLIEMVARTAQALDFKRSLHLLAVELASVFDCQRVAIGTGSARFCHVHAVSGIQQGDRRSLGHAQLASAMREAIALGGITVWPGQGNLPREVGISANQDDLLHSFRAGRVLVMPLELDEMGFRGAIALLWPQDRLEIPTRTYRLLLACQPPLAALVAFLDRTKPRAFHARLRHHWRSGVAQRLATVAGALLLIGGLLFPITYRVPADCRVEPLLRRTIAAPFESRLEKSHVKPGDRVEKDQVLAELDGREIRVALAEAIAARSAALKKRDNAMVQADPSSLQMAQLEADRLDLEVKRLQFRNDHLIIRAPLSGVVLAGDLERSEGVPVSSGQKLFEIAPLEGMILELSIPDREVRHVAPGMPVSFRLESDAARKRTTNLAALHPAAEVSEGSQVFIAEASLDNPDGFLRPGMKGEARVLSGKQPVAWIFFHGLWEYLRLKLW
jgi:biotin carboxyl carrier protein